MNFTQSRRDKNGDVQIQLEFEDEISNLKDQVFRRNVTGDCFCKSSDREGFILGNSLGKQEQFVEGVEIFWNEQTDRFYFYLDDQLVGSVWCPLLDGANVKLITNDEIPELLVIEVTWHSSKNTQFKLVFAPDENVVDIDHL